MSICSNPLLYENVLTIHVNNLNQLLIIKSNNTIIELNYIYTSECDSESETDSDSESEKNSESESESRIEYSNLDCRYSNTTIYRENNFKYNIREIDTTNISKIIFMPNRYYIYIDIYNNLFITKQKYYNSKKYIKCNNIDKNISIHDIHIL
jgi:hypothetical protein